MNNFLTSWKSTASGLLTCLAGTCLAVGGWLQQTPGVHVDPRIPLACTFIPLLCNVWLHMITPDADKVTARVPGGEVRVVAAHPVPDNPVDKAVIPASNGGSK